MSHKSQSADNDRVREYLANERTYLAWLRTGISMMGFGVVIAKLRYIFMASVNIPPSPGMLHASDIGMLFAAIGLIVVMLAGWRYLVVRNQIRNQDYHSSKSIFIYLSIIVIILGILIIWYLLQDTFPQLVSP